METPEMIFTPITVDNKNVEALIQSSTPVLLDFWAPWCGPCKMLSPLVDAAAESYAGNLNVGKVNIDDVNSLAAKYGVRGIPTLLLFKDGQILGTKVGAMSKGQLDEFLSKHKIKTATE